MTRIYLLGEFPIAPGRLCALRGCSLSTARNVAFVARGNVGVLELCAGHAEQVEPAVGGKRSCPEIDRQRCEGHDASAPQNYTHPLYGRFWL